MFRCCQVFTAAATDERKNIVVLAFETVEKIVREYFPYITETETVTFTDCVRCLIAFTNSQFARDVSLNAIAFLRFCAVKLADGGLVCNAKDRIDESSNPVPNENDTDIQTVVEKDDHALYWLPLLRGNYGGWTSSKCYEFDASAICIFKDLMIALGLQLPC